jgi:CelD/BcsL family acetyltransferase involved in cellulose biosynthesis
MAVVVQGDVRAGAASYREVTSASVQTTFTAGLDHLASFADEWEQVYAAAGNEPTNTFEWTQAIIRHRGRAHRHVGIVRLHRAAAAVGFVPLVAGTSNVLRIPCTILRPACELKNTHSDLLLAERSPSVVAALVDRLAAVDEWDCFRVAKVLTSNPIGELLCDAARARGWIARVSFSRAAYYLPLPASFDAYFAARSAKFRNHARRMEKRLHAAGRVSVRDVTTPQGWDEGFDALLAVERASWKDEHGTSMAVLPSEAAMYREWGRDAARKGRVHLQILSLDDVPIAHNLGMVERGTYYYLKTSYAAVHRPLSPATFLRLRLIEDLIARGCTMLDFPGTPYVWERQWTDTYRWQRVVSIYRDSLRGRLLASLDRWAYHTESGGAPPRHADPRAQRHV